MLNSHIGQNILILVIVLVDSITFSVLIWCLSKGLSSITTLVMIWIHFLNKSYLKCISAYYAKWYDAFRSHWTRKSVNLDPVWDRYCLNDRFRVQKRYSKSFLIGFSWCIEWKSCFISTTLFKLIMTTTRWFFTFIKSLKTSSVGMKLFIPCIFIKSKVFCQLFVTFANVTTARTDLKYF